MLIGKETDIFLSSAHLDKYNSKLIYSKFNYSYEQFKIQIYRQK